MGNELSQFINRWLYDVEQFLRDRLDTLKDDLTSEDEDAQTRASEEAQTILDWLYPPPPPLSASQRLERALRVSQSNELNGDGGEAAVDRAMRSTGRDKGRPRDETSRLAVRALGLHLATGMSWCEIAMTLKGCVHERPAPPRQKPRKRNPTLSCEACGEVMRVAVYRLRRFLKQLGYQENIPLGKELDEESRMELRKLWGVEESR